MDFKEEKKTDISSLEAKLKGLAAKAKPEAGESAEFTPNVSATPNNPSTNKRELTEEEKARKKHEMKLKKELAAKLSDRLRAQSNEAPSTLRELRQEFTKFARIIGYGTQYDAKTDFATSTKNINSVKQVNLELKQTAPSKPAVMFVMVPTEIKNAIDDMTVSTIDTAGLEVTRKIIDKYATADDSMVAKSLVAVVFSEAINFIQKYTSGRLYESTKIVDKNYIGNKKAATVNREDSYLTTYISNNKKVLEDVKTGNISYEQLIKLAHNYRSKIVTPINFIPRHIYKTLDVKEKYTAEEAAEYNKLYFARYCKSRKVKGMAVKAVLLTLSPESQNNITIEDTGNDTCKVTGSSYFSTAETSKFYSDDCTVKHWYDKVPGAGDKDAATPVTIKAKDAGLVLRAIKKSKENNDIFYNVSDELSRDGEYAFDPDGKHKVFAEASGGMLTFEELTKGFDLVKKNSSSGGSSNTISSDQYAGLAPETIKEIFFNVVREQTM